MKRYLKHLYLFILLFILILISFIAWDLINFPTKLDQIEYVGLGEKFYHPQNDTIKFFLLITFCLIFFYYFFSIFFNHSIINIKELYKIKITVNKKTELKYFIDNPPKWNPKTNKYVNNFSGRVKEASIKN